MKLKKNTKLYEWQQKCQNGVGVCPCGMTTQLTVDHIVPVFILESLLPGQRIAYEYDDNFQILCRYCNQMKGGRLDPRNPKTYLILRRILEVAEREANLKTPF